MTKIKICGTTNYKDAMNAVNLGADYLGFNFYKQSPRYIKEQNAKIIIEKLPQKTKKVGIFVNEDISKIKRTVNFCNIDVIQLSGEENPQFIMDLKKALPNKVIKSFRVKKISGIKNINKYKTDYVMLDSFKKGLYGGTGTAFDWRLAKNADKKRLFLSGGLNSLNVKLAIHEIKPYAVDVCSSIEHYPGKKDFEKMKEFIEAAK
ncbi:phosphoribosylanthranilate isomerase [Candidatus Woesearchaeota archaeon]|nr:phosphoribosylanthranilate isomerase [Candidatus Woesearchaeota archaeon]